MAKRTPVTARPAVAAVPFLVAVLVGTAAGGGGRAEPGARPAVDLRKCPHVRLRPHLTVRKCKAKPVYRGAIRVGPKGRVTFADAKQAFVHLVSPLPGVKPRPIRLGRIPIADGPVRWLLAYDRKLTAAQRRAVNAAVFGGPRTAALGIRSDEQADWEDLINEALDRVGTALGRTSTVDVKVILSDKPAASKSTLASQGPLSASGKKVGVAARCVYRIFPKGRALDTGGDRAREIAAHEGFHCLAAQIEGLQKFYANEDWLEEGAAEWAGFAIAEAWVGHKLLDSWWEDYLTAPGQTLYGRTYDATGLFAHIAESGRDPWKVIVSMLLAKTHTEAFDVAATEPFLHSWASGVVRNPALGSGWTTTGPGIINAAYVPALAMIANGGKGVIEAGVEANEVRVFDLRSDLVIVKVGPVREAKGRLRASDGAERALEDATYCVRKGGCVCPDGTPGAGMPSPPRLAAGPAEVALTGYKTHTTVSFTGESLKLHCAKKPPPPAGGTNIKLGGVVSGRYTEAGDCGRGPGDAWRAIFTTSADDRLYFLQLELAHFAPGVHLTISGVSDAVVNVGDGHGNEWTTEQTDGTSGSFNVNAAGTAGTVNVRMTNREGGGTVVAAVGSWTCRY
jgi:hypothetical protein